MHVAEKRNLHGSALLNIWQRPWWRLCRRDGGGSAIQETQHAQTTLPPRARHYTQHPVCSRSETIAHCHCKEASALASNSRRVRLWPPRRDDRGHCVSQKVQHAEAPLYPRPGLHAASLWALALDTDLGDINPYDYEATRWSVCNSDRYTADEKLEILQFKERSTHKRCSRPGFGLCTAAADHF